MSTPRPASSGNQGRYVHPALFAFVVLIGLGTWPLQGKAWNEGLMPRRMLTSLVTIDLRTSSLDRNSTGCAANIAARRQVGQKGWFFEDPRDRCRF